MGEDHHGSSCALSELSTKDKEKAKGLAGRAHYRLITVLDEIIETVFVLERVTWIADRAGLFKFNLRTLLKDFLGDVQIVAEFGVYRDRILGEFDAVMKESIKVAGGPACAELYIVAHSEGSAVAFLALLSALADPSKHPWLSAVRGFMTIGSPIETHHLLWPKLWRDLKPNPSALVATCGAEFSIPWHNYYDYGDPIAYGLNETAEWLKEPSGFGQYLALKDMSFGRSYLPGKAHVDYWSDDDVFGHFIEEVVKPSRIGPPAAARYQNAPKSKNAAIFVSYVVPQLLVAAVLFAGTYLFYRPVAAAVNPDLELPPLTVLRDVGGMGLLLLGMTAAARLPRLTDQWRWWALSAVLLVASLAAYATVVSCTTQGVVGAALPLVDPPAWVQQVPSVPVLGACANGVRSEAAALINPATYSLFVWVSLIVLVCGVAASFAPSLGTRVLPAIGGLAAILLVAKLLPRQHAELWPVVLGAAGFFYLWWLGALLFDLVFVWQRYVRHSAAAFGLKTLVTAGYQPAPVERCQAKVQEAYTAAKAKVTG